MNIQTYNKSIVALVVGGIVLFATHFGLQLTPDFQAALTTIVTTLAVYAVPNKK